MKGRRGGQISGNSSRFLESGRSRAWYTQFMKPHHRYLIAVVALVLLADYRPAEQVLTRLGAAIDPDPTPALPRPSASPTPPRAGVPHVAVLGDLLVDSAGGRLYAPALVNGLPQLAVLNAADGSLLAAWDTPGAPALDAARGRLAVDRGTLGLAFLDATTGAEATTLALPPQDVPASPQVDPRTGRFYAFRGRPSTPLTRSSAASWTRCP